MLGSCWFERARGHALPLLLGALLVPGLASAQEQGPDRRAQGERQDAPAAAQGERGAAPRDDREIADAIHREIIRDLGPQAAHRLQVDVEGGVATLSGSIDSYFARERALVIAEGIRGVRDVQGRPEVVPEHAPDDGRIEADAYKALAFDPMTRDAKWELQVSEGVVTIGGAVDGYATKCAAIETVSSLRGVRDVNDQVQVQGQVQGDQLQQALEARLQHDARIAGAQGIQVTTDPDGKVRLEGSVPSVRSRTAAREAAYSLGATDVDTSGLTIDPSATGGSGALSGGAPRGGQGRTLPAGAATGPDDDQLRQAIQSQLQQHGRLRDRQLDVAVKDGRVRLAGESDTLVGKREAEELVWSMAGVRGVENAIIVNPGQQKFDDDTLKEGLEDAYERHALLHDRGIDVEVENGRLTLDGEVRSAYEKQLAADLASRTPGVVEIDNGLEVGGADEAELLDDDEIKARIERQLFWSPFVSADKVAVTVENGVATLRGQVGSWGEVQAATENALEGGARRVVNELTVGE